MITIEQELISSKNSKMIYKPKGMNRFIVGKNKKALESEKALIQELSLKKHLFEEELKNIKKPMYICFKIYRKTNRRFDYSNIIQLILDCMVKVGILEDDNAKVLIPAFYPYEVDSKRPRLEITFKNIEEVVCSFVI